VSRKKESAIIVVVTRISIQKDIDSFYPAVLIARLHFMPLSRFRFVPICAFHSPLSRTDSVPSVRRNRRGTILSMAMPIAITDAFLSGLLLRITNYRCYVYINFVCVCARASKVSHHIDEYPISVISILFINCAKKDLFIRGSFCLSCFVSIQCF